MTPRDTVDAFDKAFKEALERLEKEKCAKLFGGRDKAIEALSGANYRVLPLGAPKVDRDTGNVSVVGAATYQGTPARVFINSQGLFKNTRMDIPGVGFKTLDFGTGLRGADFGALILLHELGHVVGIFKPDAGNEKLNLSYTARCWRTAYKQAGL